MEMCSLQKMEKSFMRIGEVVEYLTSKKEFFVITTQAYDIGFLFYNSILSAFSPKSEVELILS